MDLDPDEMGAPVTCGTCHRGHKMPEEFVIPPEGPRPSRGDAAGRAAAGRRGCTVGTLSSGALFGRACSGRNYTGTVCGCSWGFRWRMLCCASLQR